MRYENENENENEGHDLPRDFRLRPYAVVTVELVSHVDEGRHVRPPIRPRSRGWAIIALDVGRRTEILANAGRMVVPMVLASVEPAGRRQREECVR